jgi:hypothetical protein
MGKHVPAHDAGALLWSEVTCDGESAKIIPGARKFPTGICTTSEKFVGATSVTHAPETQRGGASDPGSAGGQESAHTLTGADIPLEAGVVWQASTTTATPARALTSLTRSLRRAKTLHR